VVLDLRRSIHNAESVEATISAAASILVAGARRRSLLRLVITDGTDSGFGYRTAHTDAVLDRLALASAHDGGDLRRVMASLRRGASGGALAVVTTATTNQGDLTDVARLGARYGAVTVVIFERSAYDPWAAAQGTRERSVPSPGGATTLVRVTHAQPFAMAWDQAQRLRAGARR
jgi:hypothetical protein